MSKIIPHIGQGPAKEATSEDLNRDELGFTHPNLHRRIQKDKKYKLGIYGYDSYRTTEIVVHDEESTTSEVP